MIVNINKLQEIKKQIHNDEVLGLAFGSFDLFHRGHLEFLKQAKTKVDKLLVGIMSDEYIKLKKGPCRPIISENDRANIIDNIKCVDYTFIVELATDNFLDDILIPLINALKPNVIFYDEGTPLSSEFIKNNSNILFVLLERKKGVSTTDIIKKIEILGGNKNG